jgi:hypothetical protein
VKRQAIEPREVEVGESPSAFFAVINKSLRSKHEFSRANPQAYLAAIKFVIRIRMMASIDPEQWQPMNM